jgi:hypothetical protein
MKRIGAPVIGGVFTSFLLELLVHPVIYEMWKWHFELNNPRLQGEGFKDCRLEIDYRLAEVRLAALQCTP